MISNYFKIALRNILKRKGYSLINIIGLAIGMSCFVLISFLVWDEFSFDRFNEHAGRIYRLTLDAQVGEKLFLTAKSSGPLSRSLRETVPGVEEATRIRVVGDHSMRFGDRSFTEYRLYLADSSLFRIFSFSVVEGDESSFLTQPSTIVITDLMARKYFGDTPALGKTLIMDGNVPYMVCGVVKPLPSASHWHFNSLVSSWPRPIDDEGYWIGNSWYTYVLLKSGVPARQAESAFHSVVEEHVRPLLMQVFGTDWKNLASTGMHYRYRFQPLTDIHLYSHLDEEIEPTGAISTVTMFIMIGVLILVIACINFMNLNTARSAHRAKEIGVRKVLGSQRSQLVLLFLSEAILLTFFAMILSMGVVEQLLPSMSAFIGKQLSFSAMGAPAIVGGALVLVLVVGLMAGSYPAFVLSSFQPVKVLKGEMRSGMRSSRLRGLLVLTQFTISIILIVGTIVIYRQLRYVQSKDLGFDKDQMLVIDNTWLLGNKTESFRELMLKRPGVLGAAYTQNLPGNDINSGAYRAEGGDKSKLMMFRQLWADFEFLPMIGIKLREGRYFSREIASDSTYSVIINQAAAKALGYSQPVGRTVTGFFGLGERAMKIVGVTDDFHYEPLHLPILPTVIMVSHGHPTRIVLKVHGNIPEIRRDLNEQWTAISGGQPFTAYFLDQQLETYYRRDEAEGMLFAILSSVGILISCLGLLGLTMYAAEQRTKELGIRKVLGASGSSLTVLLTKELVGIVLLANLIAWPIAYFAMNRWLQDFAYRVEIGWWVFALAGSVALLIAILTISYQAIKAVRANPVDALKYE
ncbi:MAG: ABC transporter permease [Bacteroidota bacterium]|jgi:putative ABC transport system permease protein